MTGVQTCAFPIFSQSRYGGFDLSCQAVKRYAELAGIEVYRVKNIDHKFIKYGYLSDNEDTILDHFITKPLNEDGTLPKNSSFEDPKRKTPQNHSRTRHHNSMEHPNQRNTKQTNLHPPSQTNHHPIPHPTTINHITKDPITQTQIKNQ